MTSKPPRASTKSDARTGPSRAKPRAATHSERAKPRSASVVPTDQFVRITDDDVVNVLEELSATPGPRDVPQVRLAVLEATAHLAPAQGAIVAAGHVVVRGASGTAGIDKVREVIGEVDAVLIALPGGESLIEAALALGPGRPVVIASTTASAVEATRRAAAAGADLVAVRPHDVERVAPVLLGAARLIEQRRLAASHAVGVGPSNGHAETYEHFDDLDDAGASDGALQSFAAFRQAVVNELERAQRYAYPLSIALFALEIAPPPPPPGVRGILRARTGNALVHAVRDIDLVTELEQDRFLILMPYTDRLAGAEVARRILTAVAAADPVTAAGRTFPPKVIGAVTGARPGEPQTFDRLLADVTQLLEQASVTGASLAVDT